MRPFFFFSLLLSLPAALATACSSSSPSGSSPPQGDDSTTCTCVDSLKPAAATQAQACTIAAHSSSTWTTCQDLCTAANGGATYGDGYFCALPSTYPSSLPVSSGDAGDAPDGTASPTCPSGSGDVAVSCTCFCAG